MRRSILRSLSCVLVAGACATAAAASALVTMARNQSWQSLLHVARVRSDQLPLNAEECLLVAHAAGRLGERQMRREYLERIVNDPAVGQVAAVELAQEIAAEEPESAMSLLVSVLDAAASRSLSDAAFATMLEIIPALARDGKARASAAAIGEKLSRSQRRSLQLALLADDDHDHRRRLTSLLKQSTRDLVGLEAAERLVLLGELSADEKWLVAQSLFNHALYGEAEPLLEDLHEREPRSVSAWEVAFLRGRCAFRGGRWTEAVDWYLRAESRTAVHEQRADLAVHRARALELAGDLEAAAAAAVSAVRSRTTDDRRLFLARLRLRQGRATNAQEGIARIRSRSQRDRGAMLMALDCLRRDEEKEALRWLDGIVRQPWRGPAAVLAAQVDAAAGRWPRVIRRLDGSGAWLDAYWASRARVLFATAPTSVVDEWRRALEGQLDGLSGRSLTSRLGDWAKLEVDPLQLERIADRVGGAASLDASSAEGRMSEGLARTLWGIGLMDEAVRWDPGGFPAATAADSMWTAGCFLAHGDPRRAISMADTAWRQALPHQPMRVFPESLQRASFPLPDGEAVRAAAAAGGMPWPLLAGVAREESRWQPETLSKVGARGLLQLMPATAQTVADQLALGEIKRDDLFDGALSLRLGAAELGRLLTVFDGRREVAVAAYNAGEAQARLWLGQCGPLCSEERFVQSITFTATRAYTTQVLTAADRYSALYPPTTTSAALTADSQPVTERSE